MSSFHYWPDPARALREIARVLRSSGRVVLTDWCNDFVAEASAGSGPPFHNLAHASSVPSQEEPRCRSEPKQP